MRAPFECAGALYRLLGDFDVKRGEERYDESGLSLPLEVLEEDLPRLEEAMRDVSRGRAEITPLDSNLG